MRSILSILQKIALLRGASSKFCRKLRPRAEHPENLDENRAPVRSILKILKKIALLRGASSKFRRSFVQNRAPAQSILKILKKIALPRGASLKMSSTFHPNLRPRAEHPENLGENLAPARSIRKNVIDVSSKIELPCGES